MSNFVNVKCPFCGRKKSVVQNADTFTCTKCFKHFDSDPDEGGEYFNDPTKRMQVEEAMKRRRNLKRLT